MQLQYVIRKQVSRVDLHKDGTTAIGIVLKDGVKTESRPVIKAIKKGSVAYRSHCVSAKDVIVSVCGQEARGMSRKDFKHLLREAESKIELELEYQIREACLGKCGVYRMERIYMKLKKTSESYGFVLRKYGFRHHMSAGYPVISNIKEGSPADRDGRLKAGDRLLQIDGQDLEVLSLSQVDDILQAKNEATFTIEYKIALIENSQIRLGERTDLEIDCPDADLGLVLETSGSRMVIGEIRKGSLADRCGAFRIGDDILAINDVDVAFLSTSKANGLLRNFKKEPGRLSIVGNIERLARPRQNSSRENIMPLVNLMSSQMTPEPDQQVPSNINLLVPCNSPRSLFDGTTENGVRLPSEEGHYNFQIKSIVMLREIIKNIVNLESFLSSLNSNIIGSTNDLDDAENNNYQSKNIEYDKLSRIKILSTRIKDSAHSMALNLARNIEITPNRHLGNGSRSLYDFKYNHPTLNKRDVIQELMKNLIEIYTKKLMSKCNLKKLQLKINQITSSCKKCEESCMLAALTTQKVLLIVSLNSNTKDISSLTRKLMEEVLRILPCEDCRISSELQTGSEISRTTPQFSSSKKLEPKPFSSGHVLKENTSCSRLPTGSGIPRNGVNSLDPLNNKPSSSIPSMFSYQTGSESSVSLDDESSAVTISKGSCRKSTLNPNCKMKTSNTTQPSVYYQKRRQKGLKTTDNGSLCFETSCLQSQNQGETISEHNISFGFATPAHGTTLCDKENTSVTCHPQSSIRIPINAQKGSICYDTELPPCKATNPTRGTNLCDKENTSGNYPLQSSIRIPSNGQNGSFYSEAELPSCKDNQHYEQKDNGKNYSSNIHKKLFREKGLLNAQHQSYKSAEVIVDSERGPLNHSKSKIQKHSSEPQYLSSACKSFTERVPNQNEKEHFYANVEILESNKEIHSGNPDETRYWSPFHRSDNNEHSNILDIPNWSAKSSHSMKQIDKDLNQKTRRDTVDVALKTDGKGYGLCIEFLGSSSEDSAQLPRITAVSSQGAAHRVGILQKGDRVLAINGRNTIGITVMEFEQLKEEAFGADEVLLTVEFDIIVKDLYFGTFDVYVTKTSKTGLVYNDFKKGTPLVVKGIVKGSPAHRCGALFPGDEVLCANNIRQELYDVFKNTYERSEFVIIRVKRQTFQEKLGEEINLDPTEPSLFKSYDLSRTSIHSNHGSNSMFLEQELILYRDPVARDFGFLIGQDPISKTIYVTGIRPEGPADCSKVVRKNDIILQVNGVDLEENKDGPIISLFHTTGDRLELKTRRVLKYE